MTLLLKNKKEMSNTKGRVMQKLGMTYDRSSSYTKNDGSATFESDIYVLKVGEN